MSDNYNDNIFILESNIEEYEPSSFKFNVTKSSCNNFMTDFFKELLQELYVILLNIDIKSDIEVQLNEFMNNFLFEYDLDPKDVLDIMTNNSENIFCYSSLIGFYYQYGIGYIISHRKNNYKLHIRNAEKGDNVSQYYVGNCYRYGINIKRDYNKAIEWYVKSSEGGNIKAIYKLGSFYYFGHNLIKDEKIAFELYLHSAEGGYYEALNTVGNCYYNGRGILKSGNKAFKCYLNAAEKGHAPSQFTIANYYKCVPKDLEKWYYWNRKAAINGCIDAQYKLADYYLNNNNEGKAFKWYMKLADKKDSIRALYLVAKCYRDGIGIDKNFKEATNWFNKLKQEYVTHCDKTITNIHPSAEFHGYIERPVYRTFCTIV
uniref:HCP-like protein n=1 Tax=Rhizophagus irregularis (strain DAOM 181602 / DAOM 197198 / MUCL 43194) TaxID=747089 RepID=U9TMG8_RHIID